MQTQGKFRVGQVVEIFGMDYLEECQLKRNGSLSLPLVQNYDKLTKLDTK